MSSAVLNSEILSIVLPAYNEEETLEYSHARLLKLVALPEFGRLQKIEIIYVNDGSRDRTAEMINNFVTNSAHPKIMVKALHFARNFGHSSAVFAGLETSSGDFVAIIDADLQDPPELLGPMLTQLRSGFDVVYGQRAKRKNETIFKKITAWAFYRVLDRLSGIRIPRDTGDFRLMTREACEAVQLCQEQMPFLRGLVAWVGFKQFAFLYDRDARKYGSTKYPFSKMLKFAVQALLSFSIFPLKMALVLAFLVFLISSFLGGWALYIYSLGNTVPGWASLMVVFLFMQSIILFVIGVIGLYIGQIHIGIQNRPRYILKK